MKHLTKLFLVLSAAVGGIYLALKAIVDGVSLWEGVSGLPEKTLQLAAWLADQPAALFYWIPIALIIASIASAYHPEAATIVKVWASRNKPPVGLKTPDYAAWDLNNEYTLWRAAFLWAEQTPPVGGSMSDEARPRFHMLTEAIETGALITKNKRKETAFLTVVRKEDLIAFASAKNLKPKFLFPESRETRI